MIQKKEMTFQGIAPFSLDIRYVETSALSKQNTFDPHTHDECEVYINLSGDVSFMVENHVYPIRPGSVILTRPNEFHHCIYNSDAAPHRHFWLLFSCAGNEALFPRIFDRQPGCGNLSILTPESLKKARELCTALMDAKETAERYALFFQLMRLLSRGEFPRMDAEETTIPNDVKIALDFMYENISFPITMADVAAAAHVSLNTPERHFLSAIQATPSEFLKQRRLSKAQEWLKKGASVNEACQACGFSDCSHFIVLFKKQFGMTPLQYKKNTLKNRGRMLMFHQEYPVFRTGGRSNYRIPSMVALKDGTILTFCNDRKDSVADSAPEMALVYARKRPGKEWEAVQTLRSMPG